MEARAVAVEKPFASSWAMMQSMVDYLSSRQAANLTHAEVERWTRDNGSALLCQLLQDHLGFRAAREVRIESGVRVASGEVRNHVRAAERKLETTFGTVTVQRLAYADRGAPSVFPADGELNLPKDQFSLEVRRQVAIEVASKSYQASTDTVARMTAAAIPHRQAEQLVQRAGTDFEEFYEQRRRQPVVHADVADAHLVITSDATGVPVRPEALRDATRKASEAQPRAHKLAGTERTAPLRPNRHRMAQVTAVYDVAPHVRDASQIIAELSREGDRNTSPARPRTRNKVVHATVAKSTDKAILEAFEEAARRDPDKRRSWVGLVDGNEHQLALFESFARSYGYTVCVVLDLMHVLGYLYRAAACFATGDSGRKAWVVERLRGLLEGRASNVAAGIRRSATLRGLRARQRSGADECADYLIKYRAYLHYDRYLAAGMPISTGVIEGSCRTVKDRMSITGAHWSINGAEAVLRIRALRANGDFDEYWRFHERRELERNHLAIYDGAVIPPTHAAARHRAHLRRVK